MHTSRKKAIILRSTKCLSLYRSRCFLLNACNAESIPFDENTIANKKPKDNKPPLLSPTISSIVDSMVYKYYPEKIHLKRQNETDQKEKLKYQKLRLPLT